MNNEIENRFLEMFKKIIKENNYGGGRSSEFEMFRDEVNNKYRYTQEFSFGKDGQEYKYVATIITDIAGNIIEENCEEIKEGKVC